MRRFVPKFHGGPEVKIQPSKAKRGLKQADKLKHGPVLTIVKDGEVILGKRFRRAMKTSEIQDLSPKPSVSARATPRQLPGRGGVPAKTEPPTRNNREIEEPVPIWETTFQHPEERIPGRDRGSH